MQPLEFPGGDIGALAVHGTVNDLAVAGAQAAGEELGAEVLDYCPPNNSVDEQQQKLEDLLTRGVDGIAISPIDATNMVSLLDEVADKVGLSLRSFRRRFKDATGEPPMQYLQRIRLETAKQLLATSILGVDQIAYRVGFDDASYFSRLFKRKAGVTPSEYRAQRSSAINS